MQHHHNQPPQTEGVCQKLSILIMMKTTVMKAVHPSLTGLQTLEYIQAKVEETRKDIPWPKKYILSGTNKARITYESLSKVPVGLEFWGGARFRQKKFIFEYLTDLMKDRHDFAWAPDKGPMQFSFVKWSRTKFSGMKPLKLIEFEGPSPNKLPMHKIQAKILTIERKSYPFYVDFSKKVYDN